MLRLVLVAFLLTTSTLALADPPGEAEPAAPASDSYRTQTLAADAVAATLLIASLQRATVAGGDQQAALFAKLGAATFVVAAPLVHGIHGRGQRAVGDFAMRAAPLLLGLAVFYSSSCGPYDDACWSTENRQQLAGVVIATVGGLGASVIDTWLLARGDRPPRIAPVVQASRDATVVGIGGRF